MADTTTPTRLPLLAALAAPVAAAMAIFSSTQAPAISDHLLDDSGIDKPIEMPPLSQDAATALHLQSLGKWR
ncbi:MAG: hypothetical protein AAGI10_04310 [Pseudomonadota bacterium]